MAASYMVRIGQYKLIHHIGMPQQLFDLEADPDELHDLAGDPVHEAVRAGLAEVLIRYCDIVGADAAAKADQRRQVDALGGRQIVRDGTVILFSPPPGEELQSRVKAPN
jgi:choline-sulfatase